MTDDQPSIKAAYVPFAAKTLNSKLHQQEIHGPAKMKVLAIMAIVALLATVVWSKCEVSSVTCYRYSRNCEGGGIQAASAASCCNHRGLAYRVGSGPCVPW